MKKLLLLSDGSNFPVGAFEFIKYLHEKEPVSVTGFFYSSVDYEMLITSSLSASAEGFINTVKERSEEVDKQISLFERHCLNNQIDFIIHKDTDIGAVDSIIKESRFADLLLISEEVFCKDFNDVQPNSYMKEILHRSECPVLLVPEKFKEPEKVIISYDGSKESMFAIKYFANLLPVFNNTETELVFIKQEDDSEIPDMEYLEEYAAKRFNNLTINKLPFNAKKYFGTWLEYQKNALVISGSFARSGLSRALKHSFVENIISKHTVPVFIAHNI